MSTTYDQAKSRRNALERLGEKIPGFAGFQDRELRRELDRRERESLAELLLAAKRALREKARTHTEAGRLAELTLFDRLERRLEGFAQAVRHADYGATGFFDAVKVREEDLTRLYDFDLGFFSEVEALSGLVEAMPAGTGEATAAVEAAIARLATIEQSWGRRGEILAGFASGL
ncbi:MAG TPA: hypothetical protein VF017_05450 [Thermoanaerobaculia bacterium]|nr:hypothetical protein [Thermoanaerobaculia bacterium]